MTYQLLQSLTEADQSLLLYLNGLHNTFGDYFMPVFTASGYGYRCTPAYYTYY